MDYIKIGRKQISKDLFLFLTISVLLGAVTAVENTSLANRLYEDLHFTIMQRSFLEAPREMPGLLSIVFFGILNGLGDVKIAAVANMIGGVGLICFGITENSFGLVLLFLIVYSTGQHLYIPLSSTIAMTFAKGENFGQRLGQVQGLGSLSVIVSSGILFVLYKLLPVTYGAVFASAGIMMILAGILFLFLGAKSERVVGEKRFVFRKEFKMYYILATINGARKQITITFAPWLLITVFDQPVTVITGLFFIVCVINIFFKPWFGTIIDKKGEKYALKLEALVMFLACLGFAFAKSLFSFQVALVLVSVCYVLDKLMESASMARATYVRKLATNPADVARTLTMGQSMDHVISVCLPVFAGYAWYANGAEGYRLVFIGGLVISLINYYVAGKLHMPSEA